MTHPEYPVLRKIFLQWLISERLVDFEKAKLFFKSLIEGIDFGTNDENEDEIDVFLDFCKKSLNPIGLSMKKQIYAFPDKKSEFIGICNIKSDGIAQVATKLTAEQLNSFKKMINLVKRSPTHEFTFTELEVESKIPKSQLQMLLEDLIENKWIYLNISSGLYSLGPRSILELSDFLREEEDEGEETLNRSGIYKFEECGLCSSLISSGIAAKCINSECATAFHDLCMQNFIETIAKLECPKCKILLKK